MDLKKIKYSEIPNICKINEFLVVIKNILFPNYFCNVDNNSDNLEKAHELFRKYLSNDENKEKDFFNSLSDIYKMILKDLEMTYNSDPACNSVEEALITYPGIYAIITYRIAHKLYLLDLRVESRILSEEAHSKTGIDIHPGAEIGEYFFIDHGTGIVIGETTVIGHHVKIYQGVTLGAKSLKDGQSLKGTKRHPTIGNNVTIYSGASILGGDTIIGDNITIGSNVFILDSIENNKKVIVKNNITIIK